MNHTSGPWVIGRTDGCKAEIITSDHNYHIASIMSDACGFPPDSPCLANARLIAAAPELLQELTHVYNYAELGSKGRLRIGQLLDRITGFAGCGVSMERTGT
jgi:hypothetical protein